MSKWTELTTLFEVVEAQKNGWEIEFYDVNSQDWIEWLGSSWNIFNTYRGRPTQPKIKTVKLQAWLMAGEIRWLTENNQLVVFANDPIRIPELDKVVEIPE